VLKGNWSAESQLTS